MSSLLAGATAVVRLSDGQLTTHLFAYLTPRLRKELAEHGRARVAEISEPLLPLL